MWAMASESSDVASMQPAISVRGVRPKPPPRCSALAYTVHSPRPISLAIRLCMIASPIVAWSRPVVAAKESIEGPIAATIPPHTIDETVSTAMCVRRRASTEDVPQAHAIRALLHGAEDTRPIFAKFGFARPASPHTVRCGNTVFNKKNSIILHLGACLTRGRVLILDPTPIVDHRPCRRLHQTRYARLLREAGLKVAKLLVRH